jgi:hypothetical protein
MAQETTSVYMRVSVLSDSRRRQFVMDELHSVDVAMQIPGNNALVHGYVDTCPIRSSPEVPTA